MPTPNAPRQSQCLESLETSATNTLDSGSNVEDIQPSGEMTKTPKRKFEDMGDITQPDVPPSKVPKTFIQDKNHWFPDGSVLFQIGDTRLKIHHGRLSRESCGLKPFESLMDQRVNGAPGEPYHHQTKIYKALKSVERVGGLDLFSLDFANGPNAVQFGKLLSTMENGIDHVYNRPNFHFMVDMYETSQFFCVHRYIEYAEQFLERRFPDSVLSVKDTPSRHAARALLLGLKYGFNKIARRCYYDLARIHPLQLPDDDKFGARESDDEHDGNNNDNEVNDVMSSAVGLEDASNTTFFSLLNIQRELILSWDRVWKILKYCCFSAGDCGKVHSAHTLYERIKARYPFDPVMGIKALLSDDSDFDNYCVAAKDEVKKKLKLERHRIWLQIKIHANIDQ